MKTILKIKLILLLVFISFSNFAYEFTIIGFVTDEVYEIPIENHPIEISSTLEEFFVTVYTDSAGYYEHTFELQDSLELEFAIQTYGNCYGVPIIYDEVIFSFDGIAFVSFDICHNNNDFDCFASYIYFENDSNEVEFYDISQGDVISWYWDFGDGETSFEQNPMHQFPDEGSYNVCLQIITEDSCISDYCDLVTIGQYTWLSGYVYAGESNLPNGTAILYERTEFEIFPVTTTPIVDGYYVFPHVFPFSYVILAIPELDIDFDYFPKYFPTYSGNSLHWFESDMLSEDDTMIINNINLISNPTIFYGKGEIKGNITYSSDSIDYFEDYFSIYLLDEDFYPLDAFQIDTSLIQYEFSNLPFGNYYLYIERAGFYSDYHFFTLTENNKSKVFNIDFFNDEVFVDIKDPIYNNQIKLFPNPCHDYLNIAIDFADQYSIEIINIHGEKLKTKSAIQNKSIDVKDLPSGLYFLKLLDDNSNTYIQKFIKK